jgi:hypothetical protein
LGGVDQQNGAAELRMLECRFGWADARASLCIADRLSHQGGLVGNVTTAKTTNLPTAALTRYTDGEGVRIGLEIYATIGGTATSVTVSYTNQAGTSGRISEAVQIGATNFNAASRFIQVPLASGDTGCRSVQSVTVLATTGTAGNFGVTLYRPLLWVPLLPGGAEFDALLDAGGALPQVLNDACLFMVHMSPVETCAGYILFGEDQ